MAKGVIEEIQCRTAMNRVHGSRLPFRWTLNPYRGCQHACVYCFARSTHEFLGYDSGSQFDSRIVVKVNMPGVLREELRKPGWQRESVAIGTACDPYEPVERRYEITRQVLKVLIDAANPASIVTKSVLVKRDIDLLKELSSVAQVRVNFSVGTLDEKVWRTTEPGTPRPLRRLEAMQDLVEAGVPAGVLMAPVIPMLSDSEESMEAVIRAAVEHKAQFLAPNVLHLRPGSKEWFMPFLREAYPHLLPEYQRMYRGSYAPHRYTDQVVAKINELRERWGLADRGPLMDQKRGQLAMSM
ncbi:MAG: radical SAM protein [Dehalococcoidia bacterium]